MSYSSYKLAEFSYYEIHIMLFGIVKYVDSTNLGKNAIYKLGTYTNEIIRNVAIVNEKRSGVTHSAEVTHDNVAFMSELNEYDNLIDFMINYLYTHFDALPEDMQYKIISGEHVPNLQPRAKISIIQNVGE